MTNRFRPIEFISLGKYVYGLHEDLFETDVSKHFNTREEAIEAAKKIYLENDIYTGELKCAMFAEFLKANVVIQNALDCAQDHIFESEADKFNDKLMKEQEDKLQTLLENWANQYPLVVHQIVNVKKHETN